MDLTNYFKENEEDLDFCLEEVYIDIQEQLAALIEAQDVGRVELARRMGVSKSYVQEMLSGTKNLNLKSLMKACIALNVRPEIFLNDKDEHEPFTGSARRQYDWLENF